MSEGKKRSFTLSLEYDRTNNDPRGSVNGTLIQGETARGSPDRADLQNSRVICIDKGFLSIGKSNGDRQYEYRRTLNVSCHREATTGTSDNFYLAHTPPAIMPFYCETFLMFANMCSPATGDCDFSRRFLPSTIIAKDKSDSRRFRRADIHSLRKIRLPFAFIDPRA